jgi:hypothetical protein
MLGPNLHWREWMYPYYIDPGCFLQTARNCAARERTAVLLDLTELGPICY